MDGEFDEEKNAEDFANALKAWRSGKTETPADNDNTTDNNNNKKSVHFAGDSKGEMNSSKTSFLAGLGGHGSMWEVVELPSFTEGGQMTA